ncbi:unnamed protein product [Pedinophyceae sp. YPF-701]|nr:unnamed protein product [Pedinophyceae sp. YPF-701]
MADDGCMAVCQLSEQPMDCQFHPRANQLAACDLAGRVTVFSYKGCEANECLRFSPHKKSIRSLQYVSGGAQLATGCADGSICVSDVETGKALRKDLAESAGSDDAEGVMRLLSLDGENLVAAGDEGGAVALYDVRQQGRAWRLEVHDDFVTDLVLNEREAQVVSSSGDGTLGVISSRKGKLKARSETDADDEMLSLALARGGSKVLVGCQSGVISIFSWGYWNDCSDRFPGHPSSVDAIAAYDDSTIVTGSSDGLIRVLTVLPNRMVGVVGEHMDCPIERLAISADKCVLASASHDETVRLWDIEGLDDDDGDAEDGLEGGAAAEGGVGVGAGGGADDDDGEDSDDSDAPKRKQKGKRKKAPKGGSLSVLGKEEAKRKKGPGKSGNFFSDLLLHAAGFYTVRDLYHLKPVDLSRQVAGADGGGTGGLGGGRSAAQMLDTEKARGHVITFSNEFDGLLGGGVPVGQVTEFCGVPGVGKTQLGMQLAVDVQIPSEFGGLAGKAVYVDTEGSFMVERAQEIAAACVRHLSRLASATQSAERRAAAQAVTERALMAGIHYYRVHDHTEQLAVVEQMPAFLDAHPDVRLLVLDSVTFHFRQGFSDMAMRTRVLVQMAQRLVALAEDRNVAVVLMNQVTTKFTGEGLSRLVPALGDSWAHAATNRVILFWQGSQRFAHMYKSASLPARTVPYFVTADGIRGARRKKRAADGGAGPPGGEAGAADGAGAKRQQ